MLLQRSFMIHPKQALLAAFDEYRGKDVSEYCAAHIESTRSREVSILKLFQKLDGKIMENLMKF